VLPGIMFLRPSLQNDETMKTQITIAALILSAASFDAWSQNNDQKDKELEQQQQSERSRSMQGIRTDNELKDDRQEVPSNQYRNSGKDSLSNQSSADSSETEVIQKNQDQGLGTDDDGNGLTNENNKTQSGEQRTNTPAVIQRTTSESGSPAILSGDDGKKRDGTNNVQRATPNIAGAEEIGNANLSQKNNTEKNMKTDAPRVKKQEEQPATTASEAQVQDTKDESGENADSTMRETTTQEQSGPVTAKEKRKAKREERRNRRKD
jgi:hypothetical protein